MKLEELEKNHDLLLEELYKYVGIEQKLLSCENIILYLFFSSCGFNVNAIY
jgi:hypothetical protein